MPQSSLSGFIAHETIETMDMTSTNWIIIINKANISKEINISSKKKEEIYDQDFQKCLIHFH